MIRPRPVARPPAGRAPRAPSPGRPGPHRAERGRLRRPPRRPPGRWTRRVRSGPVPRWRALVGHSRRATVNASATCPCHKRKADRRPLHQGGPLARRHRVQLEQRLPHEILCLVIRARLHEHEPRYRVGANQGTLVGCHSMPTRHSASDSDHRPSWYRMSAALPRNSEPYVRPKSAAVGITDADGDHLQRLFPAGVQVEQRGPVQRGAHQVVEATLPSGDGGRSLEQGQPLVEVPLPRPIHAQGAQRMGELWSGHRSDGLSDVACLFRERGALGESSIEHQVLGEGGQGTRAWLARAGRQRGEGVLHGRDATQPGRRSPRASGPAPRGGCRSRPDGGHGARPVAARSVAAIARRRNPAARRNVPQAAAARAASTRSVASWPASW